MKLVWLLEKHSLIWSKKKQTAHLLYLKMNNYKVLLFSSIQNVLSETSCAASYIC